MLEESFSFEKLLEAHKKCRCSKQHKKETINFEVNLSQNLVTLSKQIINKTYNLGNYKKFKIYEPKERIIEALSYKHRVVLMALCSNIIEPKFEKRLIYDNVACRKGKGTYFGIKRLEKFLHSYYKKFKNNKGYVLKCDIRKYFQSIDHTILFNKLKNENFDKDELCFLKLVIDSKNKEVST